jgi:hypothetical protein
MASNPNLIYVAWAIPVIAIGSASLLIFNDKSLISQSLQAKIEAAFEAGVTRSAALWTKYVQRSKRVEVSS